MGRGNGDATNTKPCSSCGTNRVPANGDGMCGPCKKATDRLLEDLKKEDKDK